MIEDETYRARHAPLHRGFIAVGASLLIAVFVTDLVYWQTLLFQWNNFSAWLLVAGLLFAGVAGVAFAVDLISGRLKRVAWRQLLGLTLAALLSLLNAFVHSRDAYTAVVPEGIILSGLVALLLIALGLKGWSLEARRTV